MGMGGPSLYDLMNFCLGAAAVALNWRQYRASIRRPRPRLELRAIPVAGHQGWEIVTLGIENLAQVAIEIDHIRFPIWARGAIADAATVVGPTTPWDLTQVDPTKAYRARRASIALIVRPGATDLVTFYANGIPNALVLAFRGADELRNTVERLEVKRHRPDTAS